MISQSQPVPRYLGILMLLAMSGFAAVGFFTIRKDVDNLRAISQDNTQWSASQMEVELLRFRMSLAALRLTPNDETLAEMHERFDILWSRVFMMGQGHVGENLRRYDSGHGSVAAISPNLEQIDPAVTELDLANKAAVDEMEQTLAAFQQELREYTLRVLRADAGAAELVRERIKASARTTALISVAAVLISVLSLILILRESRRQQELVEVSRRSAEASEQASRAKSRFLTMMSHELRNPLNGVLGPLALLSQGGMADRHRRLVEQAQNSGNAMLQMLSGLLDYGEVQDGRIHLQNEPFRLAALAQTLRAALRAEGAGEATVTTPPAPDRVYGDMDRIRQIFVNLVAYVLDGKSAAGTGITLASETGVLVGEIEFAMEGSELDWKLDLLMGLSEVDPDRVTTEALRPLVARGLIAATGGMLTLLDGKDGRRAIRVTVPAEAVLSERIRIYLETRSQALAAIYKAALRSDRVVFVAAGSTESVDVVLVDSSGTGEGQLMAALHSRFPGALFVSLGPPQTPDLFDDIVEGPNDMSQLRNSILGQLAS